MMSLTIDVRLCWGFSVKTPFVSKAQHAYSSPPPPTTVIGAISKPLSVMNKAGELTTVTLEKKVRIASSAELYKNIFASASAFFVEQEDGKQQIGKYWEDIVRYQTLQFQKPERRGEPKFRFNVVPAGKIYMPSGLVTLGLLVKEDVAEEKLGKDWEHKLLVAASMITSLGSKEGIVVVENVDLRKTEAAGREFRTRYYHPKRLIGEVMALEGGPYALTGIYTELFWELDYHWGDEPKTEEYVIPGSREPVSSCWMKLRLVEGAEAYKVREDGLAVFK
ncbi:MAG: type I-A CRISPR-associated protein Cas5a [Nitrososphaerota archaeon]|nr:type I-A CRISPR-associated protein Cas5a [Nitrososphaerota archaeon]